MVYFRERRIAFEKFVDQESKKMEQFRLKTIREVLSVDDLKEKVNTVDELMAICEVCTTDIITIKLHLDLEIRILN